MPPRTTNLEANPPDATGTRTIVFECGMIEGKQEISKTKGVRESTIDTAVKHEAIKEFLEMVKQKLGQYEHFEWQFDGKMEVTTLPESGVLFSMLM